MERERETLKWAGIGRVWVAGEEAADFRTAAGHPKAPEVYFGALQAV